MERQNAYSRRPHPHRPLQSLRPRRRRAGPSRQHERQRDRRQPGPALPRSSFRGGGPQSDSRDGRGEPRQDLRNRQHQSPPGPRRLLRRAEPLREGSRIRRRQAAHDRSRDEPRRGGRHHGVRVRPGARDTGHGPHGPGHPVRSAVVGRAAARSLPRRAGRPRARGPRHLQRRGYRLGAEVPAGVDGAFLVHLLPRRDDGRRAGRGTGSCSAPICRETSP